MDNAAINMTEQSHSATIQDGVPFSHLPPPPPLQPTTAPAAQVKKKKWCDLSEAMSPGRRDPWLSMKGGVIFLILLSIWSFYVIIGRVCVPAIQGNSNSGYSKGTGVGILVGYILISLVYSWSYLRLITATPGHAVTRVEKSPPPTQSWAPMPPTNQAALQLSPPSQSNNVHHAAITDGATPDPSEFGPAINFLQTHFQESASADHSSSATLHNSSTPISPSKLGKQIPEYIERPIPDVELGPRWCRFCEIVKPDRTHHCRHCGTCIMQFDHHCLWVGQCVGWANHKFFITFCFWGSVFCVYTLILLVVSLVRQNDIDGQMIGLAVPSAIFGLFSIMMLIQHVYLILTGKSTLEAFATQDQGHREQKVLSRHFGFWLNNSEKRKVLKQWKEEWGGSQVDERWRAGSAMDMWRREMGTRWYEWILPIGKALGDGMHFPQNPRFGPNGEWLQKKHWPEGVR